jgi:hypothetical protein
MKAAIPVGGSEEMLRGISAVRTPITRAIGVTALLIICMLPGLLFSLSSVQEAWTAFRVARVGLSASENHISRYTTDATGYRMEHIGGELVQNALLNMTNWPLEAVVLMPIGSLLLALIYFALSMTLCRSPWSAAAIAIYASWYYPRLTSQFGTNTYAWTNVLFLTFLVLLFHWGRSRTPVASFLIMCLFTSTFLHYHTTPIWIIAAVGIYVLASAISREGGPLRLNVRWPLLLFCIVLYFSFDTVVYGNALARLSTEKISELFVQSFFNRIVAPLFMDIQRTRLPFEMAPTSPLVATWTTLLVLVLLTAPVAAWVATTLYRAARARSLAALFPSRESVFVWAIIAVSLSHDLMYSLYGSVSLRVIALAFPLILPLILRDFRVAMRGEVALLGVVALCAVLGFLSYYAELSPDTIASETGLSSRLIRPNSSVLADANTYGSLMLTLSSSAKVFGFVWIDSQIYQSIVGISAIDWSGMDYLVVDMSGKPIISSNWAFFEPWSLHLDQINRNAELDKIYDNGNTMLFQSTGSELPGYQLTGADLVAPVREAGSFLHVLLSIVALFIFPGTVATFIIHTRLRFAEYNPYLYGAIAIGLSVAFVTFIGYIVNFSPLGLSWFAVLLCALPAVALAVHLLWSRPRVKVSSQLLSLGVGVIAAILIWSIFASQVMAIRTERSASATEFFVTQDDDAPEAIVWNIVNRGDREERLNLVVLADSAVVKQFALPPVAPGSFLREAWPIPADLGSRRVTLSLLKDGAVYRELRVAPAAPQAQR